MLKKRLIAGLTISGAQAVQSRQMHERLPIGCPAVSAAFLSRWGADEIALIDIDAAREQRVIAPEVVRRTAKVVSVPLLVGGGIKSAGDATALFKAGADKILLGSAAVRDPQLITALAEHYGNQAVVVCLDVQSAGCRYKVMESPGAKALCDLEAGLEKVISHKAGEIVLRAIDRDGLRGGMELGLPPLLRGCKIPAILAGGAGSAYDIAAAFRAGNLSGVLVGNLLSHFEHSVAVIKRYLTEHEIAVRPNDQIPYTAHAIEESGRVAKAAERHLETIRFKRFQDEVI